MWMPSTVQCTYSKDINQSLDKEVDKCSMENQFYDHHGIDTINFKAQLLHKAPVC